MKISERIQEDMKAALRAREADRLGCLRLMKGALQMKEKESGKALPEEEVVATLRSEIRKRQQSIEIFDEHGRAEETRLAHLEIALIESYLPQQLSPEDVEKRVRAYYAEHPEIDNAGRLTGALKKELGDTVDGKVLNEICRRVVVSPEFQRSK